MRAGDMALTELRAAGEVEQQRAFAEQGGESGGIDRRAGGRNRIVRRFPLAVGQVRYNGEWVAAVVADSRAAAEDADSRAPSALGLVR